MNTSTLITAALLVPFWWGMGLLTLALIGDLSHSTRPRVSHLLDRIEGTRPEPAASTVVIERYAA